MKYLKQLPAWRGGHIVAIDLQEASDAYLRAKEDRLPMIVTEDGLIVEPGTEYEWRILGYKPEAVKA